MSELFCAIPSPFRFSDVAGQLQAIQRCYNRREFKIDMEMFDVNYIVGICSVFDEQKDCDLLFFALEEIDNRYKKCKKLTSKIVKTSNVETEMQIYETFDLDFEICKLKDSSKIGRASCRERV